LARLANGLKAASAAVDEAERCMGNLADAHLETQAPDLVHRYARARRQRADCLAELSAWLVAGPIP